MGVTIYLKEDMDDTQRDLTLVHEFTHSFHLGLDPTFSSTWDSYFPSNERGYGLNPSQIEQAGLVSAYSAFRQGKDSLPIPIVIPPSLEHVRYDWTIPLFLPGWDDALAQEIAEQVSLLPASLSDIDAKIVVVPLVGYRGLCVVDSEIKDPFYRDTAEDVATSTEAFYGLLHYPEKFQKLHRRLKRNRKTKLRLEVLVEFGFLDDYYLDLLRG